MNREIYVSNDDWIIAPIAEIDRTDYVELHRQINGDGTLFLNAWQGYWETIVKCC